MAHQIQLTSACISPVDGSTSGLLSERGIGASALEITFLNGKQESWFVLSFATMQECDKWMQHICLAIDLIQSQDKKRRQSMQSSQLRRRKEAMSPTTHRIGSFRTPSARSTGSATSSSSFDSTTTSNFGTSPSNSFRTPPDGGREDEHKLGGEEEDMQGEGDREGGIVHCPHCNEVLSIPASAHVMKCHFCRRVFLHRPGRTVGKPVFNDGYLGVVSKSGLFGSKKIKSRYCVLTNTEVAVFKSMDVFLHQGTFPPFLK